MKRVKIIISGKVTGVLFRDFVRKEGERLGIKGYVRNIKDQIEIIAEGDEDSLKEFEKSCRRGPLLAFVKNFEIKDDGSEEKFEDFEIRF